MKRLYFMDSMRSVLMMLGVVLHSAQVFNPDKSWVIYSHKSIDIAGFAVQIIHSFRMPAFFVIAGFFCLLTIKKYKPKGFIKISLQRIIIPLIAVALTLNIFQIIILEYANWNQFDLVQYIFLGGWISHLWFLINLIVYFAMTAILVALINSPRIMIGRHITNIFMSIPLSAIILIMPIISIFFIGLNKVGFPLYSDFMGIFKTFSLLKHLPYFYFGVVLASNINILYRFSNIDPRTSVIIIFFALLSMQYSSFLDEGIQKIVIIYAENIITWLLISISFYVFYKFFNKPSKKWRFMSEASYTIYLFHHIFVIAIGLLLIQLELPSLWSMILLISTTIMITVFIHKYFISKIRIARFLFNGK